jgi:hypothetical protein
MTIFKQAMKIILYIFMKKQNKIRVHSKYADFQSCINPGIFNKL